MLNRLFCRASELKAPHTTYHPQRPLKPLWMVAFAWGLVVLSTGCADSTEIQQTAFQIRTDFTAGLNDTHGWGGAVNEQVMVYADQPFRIRFELEGSAGNTFRLQYKRNEGTWTNVEVSDFPYPESASPRVSIVSTDAYAHNAATEDLLEGSNEPYTPGTGINLSATTTLDAAPGGHSEWEWPLVIRRFADGAVTNDEGDIFAFRVITADGTPIHSSSMPTLPLAIKPGHLGGTFVETPGRIGPWQASNGDLYFIMEPTETHNVMMMVKSKDKGRTWSEVDGINRPKADDLEGVASVYAHGVIHILHQTSDHVWYHAFHTSEHTHAPDAWSITDEQAAAPAEPPTQVAAITARSDGTIVGVYGGPQKIHYKIRSAEGSWSNETILDPENDLVLSGPQIVTGKDDVVHLAYTGNDGTAWHRRLLPDGTLTDRQLLSRGIGTTEYDVGSILPLVFISASNTSVVLYRLETGKLWERRIFSNGSMSAPTQISERLVIQNAVDSDQTGADAIAFNEQVHVVFIEKDTGSIYSTYADSLGNWQIATLQFGTVKAQWIRGMLINETDRTYSYGYVYDAGSNGGSGMNAFANVFIEE